MNPSGKLGTRSDESPERRHTSVQGEFSDLGKDTLKGLWENLLKSAPKNVSEQLVGNKEDSKKQPQHGELVEGEEISLLETQNQDGSQEMIMERKRFHERYVTQEVDNRQAEALRREEAMNKEQVKELQEEIKQLIDASQEMEAAFKQVSNQVSMGNMPEKPGKYHIGFFEWVLHVVKNARKRIESGSNWLSMFSNKKQQKQYWNMAKKHGTSFSLSQERSTATQTG